MKLKKSIFTILATLLLCACSTTPKKEPIKVMVPMGATALSLLPLYAEDKVSIDTVDGSDSISAQLLKKDGYDVIVAPINLGAKLINSGKSEYLLDCVVTWGNLYLVGTHSDALKREGTLAAFGEAAVPQKVLQSSLNIENIVPSITYFNSVNDVQAQLLTQKATVGLLAEPAASATIAKAKEKGMDLQVIADLQKEYKAKNKRENDGYPQAALFIKKGSEDKVQPYLKEAQEFANETVVEDENKIIETLKKTDSKKLGVPSSELVQKTWQRLNINFVKAMEVKTDIDLFLQQFKIELNDAYYTN